MGKRSEYDAEKDVLLEDFGLLGETSFFLEVRSYDGAAPRAVVRRYWKEQEGKSSKIFSVPLADAVDIGEFLVEELEGWKPAKVKKIKAKKRKKKSEKSEAA